MNILITSVGRRTYLVEYFKKTLGNKGEVHASNSSAISPALKAADKSIITPLIYDKEYIPFLVEYCKKNKIKMIISLFDIDLYVLSLNKYKFEEVGCKVIVSDSEFIKICNDKWLSFNYLKKHQFNTPMTYIDFELLQNDLTKNLINFPIIIKPRWGMGSLSIYEADDADELNVLYKKIKKEIQNSYMKYESKQDLDNAIIFQEKLKGQEYGMDVINDLKGNCVGVITRKKIAMRSGETDCAEIVNNEDLIEIGTKLGNITNHIANLDVDAFYSNGQYYILEMNARFGGGYPFSHMSGIDLPSAIVNWYNNEDVSKEKFIPRDYAIYHKDITIKKI